MRMKDKKTVIIIAGPTAVGKTGIAIEVAKLLGTKIISADSRQCYQEMDIGVARPSENELAAVQHYFIASHSIHQKVNAGSFEQYALEKTASIFQTNSVAVMVGGTGLYIKAFCEGMDEIPEVSADLRDSITNEYKEKGLEWLQQQVKSVDPQFFAVGEVQNPHRLMRALEVYRAVGKSILSFRKGEKKTRDFNIIKLALELPKEQLHHNINTRVDKMIEAGLEDEVRALLPYQHLPALQTVGYKELFEYFSGNINHQSAIDDIKKNTRQYAKRQMTWLKRDKVYHWLNAASGKDSLMSQIQSIIKT